MLTFSKKLMSQSQENLRTDGRTDGRTDEWTEPILQDPSSRGWGSKNE